MKGKGGRGEERGGETKLTKLLRVGADFSQADDLKRSKSSRGESKDNANDDDRGNCMTRHPSEHGDLKTKKRRDAFGGQASLWGFESE